MNSINTTDSNILAEVIVGTNEEFLLGYFLILENNGSITFNKSFTNHAHIGRVKQVSIFNQYLVSGGSDEQVKIFNLDKRREIGQINHHEGTITCLAFHKSGYLFSGAEDGKILIFKAPRWELQKELICHTSVVTDIALHPSGKLGLSIAKDKKKVIWDLTKGKRAYVAGLKQPGDIIEWSPSGSYYVIATEKILNVYSIETGLITHTIDFKSNINAISFLTDDLLLMGGEGKNICIYNMSTKSEEMQWKAHENRLKSLLVVDSSEKNSVIVASASSDGFIKIWKINILITSSEPELLGEVNTDSRIICMAVRSSETEGTITKSTPMPVTEKSEEIKKRKIKRKKPSDGKVSQVEISQVESKKRKFVQSDNTDKSSLNRKKLDKKYKSGISKKMKEDAGGFMKKYSLILDNSSDDEQVGSSNKSVLGLPKIQTTSNPKKKKNNSFKNNMSSTSVKKSNIRQKTKISKGKKRIIKMSNSKQRDGFKNKSKRK